MSPAERSDLDDRMVNATSRVQTADQSIDPIRKNLERTGQVLNPDTMNAIRNMHSSLARAQRDIDAGNASAAKDDLAAAEAFAAKVLKSVGR